MTMHNNPQSAYLRSLAIFTVLILAVCALGNWFVDPYDMFGSSRISGINQKKPAAETRERITKPYRVLEVQPKTLILGNSRPELGLDPSYHCWPGEMRPVYNMAMLGAGLYMNYRNFQHAVHNGRIKHVFLGLDFLFFVHQNQLTHPEKWNPPEKDLEQLQVFAHGNINPQFKWNQFSNRLKTLLSLQAVTDSIHTIIAQRNPNSPTLNPDGHNPARQFLSGIATEGQQVLFAQKNRAVAKLLSQQNSIFQGDQRWSESFEILRRILVLADSHNIQVTLFINARHADYLNLIAFSGKWSMLEEWKRVLTVLAERYKAQVWDFHDFDTFSTPPAPSEIGEALAGYWEPGHYRPELGNAMLNSMVGKNCKSGVTKVGSALQSTRIEEHLEKLSQHRQKYIKKHHKELMELKKLYTTFSQ